jgi:hypothetical protein
MKRVILAPALLVFVTIQGCASFSNNTKTVLTMIGAGIIAGTIDANIGSGRHSFDSESMAVGLGASAAAGVASLYYYDDEGKKREAERKLRVAQSEIDSIRDQNSSNPKLVTETNTALDGALPPQYQRLIEPGKSQVYRLNQWISGGDNVIIHQDQMIKMVPPQLKPQQSKE